MTIDQIIKMYKKSMWLRKCRFYNIDEWELIENLKVPVYITPKNIGKITIISNNCLLCNTKFSLKMTGGNFVAVPLCKCGVNKKCHTTIEKLKRFMTEENAKVVLKSQNEIKTRKFPAKVQYWINLGYSNEQAKLEVKKFSEKTSKLSRSTKKGARGYSQRTKEYWIKKGFNEEEAIEKVKQCQIKNGLLWYQNKYGNEIGKLLYEERIDAWLHRYYSREDINFINSKKSFTKIQYIKKFSFEKWCQRESRRLERQITTRIKNGLACPRELLTDREVYFRKVRYYTAKSLEYYKDIINPKNLSISYETNHIDHIFSKHHGFIFNVAPEIIGSYINLRVLPQKDNLSKHSRSDVSLKELKEQYENIDKNWHTIISNSKF